MYCSCGEECWRVRLLWQTEGEGGVGESADARAHGEGQLGQNPAPGHQRAGQCCQAWPRFHGCQLKKMRMTGKKIWTTKYLSRHFSLFIDNFF